MGGKKDENKRDKTGDNGKKEQKKDYKDYKKNGGYGGYGGKRSDNPDVLYGRDFEGETIEIETIDGEIGEVTIRGKILMVDSRELRSGKTIMIFDISDFTDTITVQMFAREEQLDDLKAAVQAGTCLLYTSHNCDRIN